MQYSGQAEQAGLGLRFSPGGKSVASDPQLLERILGNLIQNAIKYTERGGIVVVARSTSTHVNVEVWDTGVGISEPDLPRVFEEFCQVGRNGRVRAQGLGMGLAIVKRLARLLGHRLSVRSRLGGGTMFRIGIPIGGLPGVGGIAVGPSAILDSLQVFDWYDGGGIDVACLSFGEVDRLGNVNVARFSGMMPGSGGFINIVHAARKVVFCGTLTAKGLRTAVGAGGLRIEKEGAIQRFVADVELVRSFSPYALLGDWLVYASLVLLGALAAHRRRAGSLLIRSTSRGILAR